MMTRLWHPTPLGGMLLAAAGETLVGAWFRGQKHFPRSLPVAGEAPAAAALAARGSLALWPLFVGGTAAAFCGDQLNFGWGVLARKRLAGRGLPRVVKASRLEAARQAFAGYGPMAIVLARFVPMLRSVAPLAAGLAGMPGRTFAGYNLCGKLPWTAIHVCGGYFLGSIPWFARHFAAVILAAALFPFAIAAIRALVLHFAAKRSAR